MRKLVWFCAGLLYFSSVCSGQEKKDALGIDTTFYDYDEIFSELDALIDSLYTPRSFRTITLGAGNGYFNYVSPTNSRVSRKKIIFSPAVGFYHKSGLGFNASSSIIRDSGNILPYQYSLTGSYDYLAKRNFITGVAFTRFLTKKNLDFYTSPLQNELFGYFTYRDLWIKPSLSGSYGWGSRQSIEEQTTSRKKLRRLLRVATGNVIRDSVTTITTTNEDVVDFNLSFSVRHDFYFLRLLHQKDYVRLTPQLSINGGTQQFGFNSVSNTSLVNPKNGLVSVVRTQSMTLDEEKDFRLLSLTAQLRTEYAFGKFFLQPQLFADYYFPAEENKLTATFFVSAGILF